MSAPKPTRIAIAVVRHEGRVLIGPRPEGAPLAGFWEFPGGKVQPGETAQGAAARECREETGLEVRIGSEHLTVEHDYAHGLVELHFFDAAPVDPTQPPTPPFRWVPLCDLDGYSFPPANAEMLVRLRQ